MTRLVAAAREVVGLFVTDWIETAVIIAVLATGWALVALTHQAMVGGLIALALVAQLVWFTRAETVRRRAPRRSRPRRARP